ncbi:hypothetical protein VPNG_00048 [Cytospora leucostoma]|uniref:Zn(2)-C6 fungal-type domain-containing protein n=1 Tax=Cytospora leucostoma TaxID=1230097 RepID=A0A423XNW3_9PEZI|nr:hypothetical protein VPNG_00048 [Cytospora leucostoma]
MSTGPAFGKFRLKGSRPDSDSSRARKRRRKTLSCVQCHRTKVKCDRNNPCGRCSKAGRGHQCAYKSLETASPEAQDEPERRLPSQSDGLYYASPIYMNTGLTHWAKLIEELGDVKMYIFDQDEEFHESFAKLTAVQSLYATQSMSYNYPFGDYQLDSPLPSHCALLERLPPRALVVDLVDNYMSTYEKTHRLLHPPQFQRELEEFYAAPQDVPVAWVAQFLMMLALSTISASQHLTGMLGASIRDDISRNYQKWAAAYLRQSPYMNAPDLCSIRTLCMMTITKGLDIDTPAHARGAWALVGFIVRLAMSMFLHRDMASYSEITAYEAEMRRRVWGTIVFLDLDAAIEAGLPPTIRPDDSDTAVPLNIDDMQLDPSPSQARTHSALISLAQPRSSWTDSSFHIRLAESYPIVSRVLSIVNSTRPGMDSRMVEECDKKLRDTLRETNTIFAHLLNILPSMEKVLVLQQTMFEVFIRRILLALHHACVRDSRYSSVYELSHVSILECSLALLYAQQTLQEKRERLPSTHWFADLYQGDFSVAILHVLIGLRDNKFPGAELADDGAQQPQQMPRIQARETTLTALRASYGIIEASVGRSFHLFRVYFGLTLSIAAFEAAERGDPLPEVMQEAAERIIEVAKRQRAQWDGSAEP